MGMQSADWVFTAGALSATQARTSIAGWAWDLSDEDREIALLLTSELVTNAVLHGAGPVEVHMVWGEGDLRIEIGDQSPELPVMRAIDVRSPDGRGLHMVEGLSTDWGVSPAGAGKIVWFTL